MGQLWVKIGWLNLKCARTMFAVLLISTWTLGLNPAQAGRKIASVRNPARSATRNPARNPGQSAGSPQAKLSEQDLWLLKNAALDRLARILAENQSPADFKRELFSRLPERDRTELAKESMGFATPVKVIRRGDALIIEDASNSMEIRWPGFPAYRFAINGVDWNYNPRQPLRLQLVVLMKKMELAAKPKSDAALYRLMVPESRAAAGAVAALWGKVSWSWLSGLGVAVVSGIVVTKYQDIWCGIFVDKTFGNPEKWAGCLDWAGQKKDALQKLNGVKVDTIEKSRADSKELMTSEWFADPKWQQQCPSTLDKSKNTLVADFQKVTMANGQIVSIGERFSFKLNFNADGKPVDGFTSRAGTDMNSSDALLKADNLLKFDKDGVLTDIYIPNPNYKPLDPGTKPYLPISVAADETTLKSDELSRRDEMKSLVKSVKDTVSICRLREIIRQYREKIKDSAPSSGKSDPVDSPPAVESASPTTPPSTAPTTPGKTIN